MGEARRKKEADWAGKPRPRDEWCPSCGSKRIVLMPVKGHFEIDCDWQSCLDCKAVWEPFPAEYVRDPVSAEPCDNCAFRPGSPEQQDPERWRALMASLKPDGSNDYGWSSGRFYCHKGVPVDLTKGPGNFLWPKKPVTMNGEPVYDANGPVMTEDISRMRTCTGFLRMIWAHNARRRPGAKAIVAEQTIDDLLEGEQ